MGIVQTHLLFHAVGKVKEIFKRNFILTDSKLSFEEDWGYDLTARVQMEYLPALITHEHFL